MAGRLSVNVLAIIADRRNRVLLVKYWEHGEWTLPGGPVRDGERMQPALAKAVRARVGLEVEVKEIFDTYKEADKDSVVYLFICKEIGGILTLNQRAVEFGIFGIDDIPANVDPGVRDHLFNFWRDPRPIVAISPDAVLEDVPTVQGTTQPNHLTLTAVESPPLELEPITRDFPAFGPEREGVTEAGRPSQKRRWSWHRLWWVGPGMVALAVGLLYSITRRGYFVADDFIFLNQLTFKQPSFTDNLVWFTRDWGVGVNFYRPWVRLAYYFEFAFFGENAAGWHLFSTGLHVANSLLVCWLAWLLLRRIGAATVAGLVFGLQPIHTEPVAWISGQTDLWATLFTLLSAGSFVRARQLQRQKRRSLGIYLVALAAFVMALFSKEAAIALPLALVAYDVMSAGLDWGLRKRLATEKGSPTASLNLRQVLLYQVPFWLVLAGYFGLRFALFKGIGGYETAGQDPNILLYLQANLRWLAFPFKLGGTDGLILLAVVIAFLGLTGVQEWERFRLAQGQSIALEEGDIPPTGRRMPSYWNLRAAFYGVVWTLIFLLPAILTAPAERFTYLPSVGFALFLAVCLTPFSARLSEKIRPAFRFRDYFEMGMLLRVSAIAVVLIVYFASANERAHQWNDAGATAQSLLARTKEVIPGVVHYTVFVSQGLPESGDDALIFRTGYPEAIQLLYKDSTLEAKPVAHFPIIEGLLDRTIFLQYRDNKLINHQEIGKTLLQRNASLKKEKEFAVWDFTKPKTGEDERTGPRGGSGTWAETSGFGQVAQQNGVLTIAPKEKDRPQALEVQSPGISLPAVQLGTVEITLKATARNGSAANSYKVGVSWEALPTGEARTFPTVPIEIKADGQFYTYRVTPPVVENYYYTDTVVYLRLELPPELQEVALQIVKQNSIPVEYTNLAN